MYLIVSLSCQLSGLLVCFAKVNKSFVKTIILTFFLKKMLDL